MSHSKREDKAAEEEAAPKTTEDTTEDTGQDAGANPPTDTLEEATEAGYLGQPLDQTPNEAYTVQGVGEVPEPKEEEEED